MAGGGAGHAAPAGRIRRSSRPRPAAKPRVSSGPRTVSVAFPSPSGGGQGGGLVRNASEGINPKTAGWTYLSFRTVRCRADDVLAGDTGADETALIWLGGRAEVDGFGQIGEREDVFTGLPSAIVLPPRTAYRMRARSQLHLAIVSAPAEAAPAARLIRPGD